MRRALLLVLPLAALGIWLWTSARLPGPVPSQPVRSAFTQAQIDRARDYRDPGYAITGAGMAVQLAAAWLVAWRGRRIAARLPAVLGVALAVLVVELTGLPFGYWLHRRAVDIGPDVQSDGAWIGDALTGAALVTLAIVGVYLIARPLYRRWGALPVVVAVWASVAVFAVLQPLVVDPLFMSTSRLPVGPAGIVTALERRMDAHPSSVRVSDASSRTTAENAEVDGLGPTVRVVIDDTALHEPAPAFRALVAHELGHVQRRHTFEGVLWFGVIGVPALLIVLWAAGRIARTSVLDASAAPVLVACALTAATVLLPVENLISRRIEAEADWSALRATRDGGGMVQLQRRLALRNLSNPAPPEAVVWLLFDHPTVMQRIAVARGYGGASSSP
ncbi:MAG TPA: M48 family metalloprotease [Gaiellales bacterium]